MVNMGIIDIGEQLKGLSKPFALGPLSHIRESLRPSCQILAMYSVRNLGGSGQNLAILANLAV